MGDAMLAMSAKVRLYGYQHSVYSWIARLALHEKGCDYTWIEVDPFADRVPDEYLALHPFGRVPALVQGDFVLYETRAVTHYIDEALDGPHLQPATPRDRARAAQIISVIDNYAYWPLVRQVFSHDVFRPRLARPSDAAELQRGLDAAPRVLAALERLADDGPFLVADCLTLADIHLAPMISYFSSSPHGAAVLQQHPRLLNWWLTMAQRPALIATRPSLPQCPA